MISCHIGRFQPLPGSFDSFSHQSWHLQ